MNIIGPKVEELHDGWEILWEDSEIEAEKASTIKLIKQAEIRGGN